MRTKEEIDDRIERLLARKGIIKPSPLDYEKHPPYFEAIKKYNEKKGFVESEIMNGRLGTE